MKIIFYVSACQRGWYGDGCSERCSEKCKDNVTCRNTDGSCPNGCIAGYSGVKCDSGINTHRFGCVINLIVK